MKGKRVRISRTAPPHIQRMFGNSVGVVDIVTPWVVEALFGNIRVIGYKHEFRLVKEVKE